MVGNSTRDDGSSDESDLYEIKALSRQLHAHALGSAVLSLKGLRDAKANLVRTAARISFGPEALQLSEVQQILDVDINLFRIGLSSDPKQGDHPQYGYARAISGVWRLTLGEYDRFWREPERDWDDLPADSFEYPQGCSKVTSPCIGINVTISIPHIAGQPGSLVQGWAVKCLTQHLRELTGKVTLNDAAKEGSRPRWITTVEIGKETAAWAESLGMEKGFTTTHKWTKYRLDLNKTSQLSSVERAQLKRFLKIVNGKSSLLLV